eukprot:SAG31_NODE_12042_length_974_cov_5.244571_2_plen_85_part_00
MPFHPGAKPVGWALVVLATSSSSSSASTGAAMSLVRVVSALGHARSRVARRRIVGPGGARRRRGGRAHPSLPDLADDQHGAKPP